MTYSTNEIKEFIARTFGVKPLHIRKIHMGNINEVYFVKLPNGKCILRIYKHWSYNEVKTGIKVFAVKGLPIPKLVSTKGKKIFLFKSKPAIVYEYIEGSRKLSPDTQELFEVGQFLASLHMGTKKLGATSSANKFYHLPSNRIKKIHKFVSKTKVPYQNMLPWIESALNKFALTAKLPKSLIHVDVKPNNVLFKSGHLAGVLDFDNSYYGPMILDLAKSMAWFGFSSNYKKFNLKRAAIIYKGYISKRRLSTTEKENLFSAFNFAFLSHAFVEYYMFAQKKVSLKYFNFIVNVFLKTYTKTNITEEQFNKIVK